MIIRCAAAGGETDSSSPANVTWSHGLPQLDGRDIMVREDREDADLQAETGRAPGGGKRNRSQDGAGFGGGACYTCGQARDRHVC